MKGCGSTLVLDGNMKNARMVCSCNSVGEVMFKGLGSVVIGTCGILFHISILFTIIHGKCC